MDTDILNILSRLIRNHRTAALGTLHDGAPYVSMVPYAMSTDFARFHLHLSGLAQHTRDLLRDPRVCLLIAETDEPGRNPLELARVTILGKAERIPDSPDEHAEAGAVYLERFPEAVATFRLGDFAPCRRRPEGPCSVAPSPR